MKQLPRTLAAALALFLAGAFVGPQVASAQESVIDYRKSLMNAFRTHMGGVSAALSDAAPVGHAEHHAVAFERMAQALANVFPEGSMGENSRALPAIWQNRDDFLNKVTAIQSATARLVTASRSGDAEQIGTALQAVRGTCAGCHNPYRGPAN